MFAPPKASTVAISRLCAVPLLVNRKAGEDARIEVAVLDVLVVRENGRKGAGRKGVVRAVAEGERREAKSQVAGQT